YAFKIQRLFLTFVLAEFFFFQCRTSASEARLSQSTSIRKRSISHEAKNLLPLAGGCPRGFKSFARTRIEMFDCSNPRHIATCSGVSLPGKRCTESIVVWSEFTG